MSANTVKASFMSIIGKNIEKKHISIKQGQWVMICCVVDTVLLSLYF